MISIESGFGPGPPHSGTGLSQPVHPLAGLRKRLIAEIWHAHDPGNTPSRRRRHEAERRCTHEYDLRLSAFFGTAPGLWMNFQLDYELMRADREKGEAVRKEVQPCAA